MSSKLDAYARLVSGHTIKKCFEPDLLYRELRLFTFITRVSSNCFYIQDLGTSKESDVDVGTISIDTYTKTDLTLEQLLAKGYVPQIKKYVG